MTESTPRGGWLQRMRNGLAKSTARLSSGIGDILTKRHLDQATLDDLEELLITADLGVGTAALLTENLAKSRFGKTVTQDEIRTAMAQDVEAILAPVAKPLVIDQAHRPHIILVVGVNGTGKTTTIGKLASRFRQQ
ncbi:MAG: signal recognition particle receptor subunit alpha, partial [Alphaproteobacteria bacterium]